MNSEGTKYRYLTISSLTKYLSTEVIFFSIKLFVGFPFEFSARGGMFPPEERDTRGDFSLQEWE